VSFGLSAIDNRESTIRNDSTRWPVHRSAGKNMHV
jgi:hypothetical protein